MKGTALVVSTMLCIGSFSLAFAQATQQTTPAAPLLPPAASTTTAPSSAQGTLIDINSASSEQLQTLSGIGPARAEAIVKGRPYRGKDELHRKSIIPEGVYESIKDKIIARQS